MKRSPTILNNILGPITVGPSSSNTCAPCRIAYYSRKLLSGKLQKAVVEFYPNGAYPMTYLGMRTDYAFAQGFLERLPDRADFLDALDEIKKQGISLEFKTADIPTRGSLTSKQILENSEGETVEVLAVSCGGGMFHIFEINGYPVDITGECYELLLLTDEMSAAEAEGFFDYIKEIVNGIESGSYSEIAGKYLFDFKSCMPVDEVASTVLKNCPKVRDIKTLPPVMPMVSRMDSAPPFDNAFGLLQYCEKHNKEIWEAAVDYESSLSGWSREQIFEYIRWIISITKDAIANGLRKDLKMEGIVKPSAAKMADNYKTGEFIPSGVLNTACTWALAIMESSNASGVVACIPTGGAAGIVPGALLTAAQAMDLSEDKVVKAYLVCGILGICMAQNNDFCGAELGCQAEIGCASCMAAGGLAYLMGAAPGQILDAASVAMQNMLGLICDPVAGRVQVPCFARNFSGIANALASANAVMAGFDACIPLDEVIETMKDVGRKIPSELRACGGGLSKTKTAQAKMKEMMKKNK